jgi:hypothetical protein
MKDAFSICGDRRSRHGEVADYIAKEHGISMAEGFSEMVFCGGRPGGRYTTPFLESHDTREWFLPLTADGPLRWDSKPLPDDLEEKVGFALGVGFGNGSPLPQPTGRWDIAVNGRQAISVRVVKHSQLWTNDDCAFAFSANRIEAAPHGGSLHLSSTLTAEAFAAFGPAMLVVPRDWVEPGKPVQITVTAKCRGTSTRWFMLTPAPSILTSTDIYRTLDVLEGERPTVSGKNVYFGDIHTHSGVYRGEPSGGCGTGSREENYDYAAGPAGIDFHCLSDHECQIEPDGVEEYFAFADRYNKPGTFVTLRGYEFTSIVYGHRNIYFRGSGGTVFNACRDWYMMATDYANATTVPELWPALEACGESFLSVPHHPPAVSHPFNWDLFNPKHERLVEVYSIWGSSEYYGDVPRGIADRHPGLYVREALKRGYRFGLIASSDGHDGQPGNSQRRPYEDCGRHGGSGWAAVLTDELTRENVFDALYARRCYGTSGVPIVLSVEVNGAVMGSELPAMSSGKPVLRVVCDGANGIDHIRIVKNGQFAHTHFCHGEWHSELEWTDDHYDPSGANFYYVRVVQVDGESAWSSPIWVG